MTIANAAHNFFEACETGKGWEACKTWCYEDATFSCQADALADVSSLSAYTEWMKGLLGPVPDGHYELKGFATDENTNAVLAFAVFHGSHTGDSGPVPQTGQTVASDYVYAMEFEGDRIRHMTKVWNDVAALRALGWA